MNEPRWLLLFAVSLCVTLLCGGCLHYQKLRSYATECSEAPEAICQLAESCGITPNDRGCRACAEMLLLMAAKQFNQDPESLATLVLNQECSAYERYQAHVAMQECLTSVRLVAE